MSRTHPKNARIAVAGAGPAGLTFARVLQRNGLDVTVYERDTAVDSRSQGGSLDMHADSGQIALAGAGLLDEFLALARPEDQSKRVMSPEGELVSDHHADDGDTAAPEIDRGQLRRLLADSVEPETIRWGSTLRRVSPNPDGTHTLRFDDSSDAEADLVVGADGAWSTVRPLVSARSPEYSGVTFVEARFEDADRAHPTVAELVGGGHLFAFGGYKGLIGQRNSDGRVGVFIGLRDEPDWYRAAGVDPRDTPAMRVALLERFAGWDERLLALISDNDGHYANRPLYALRAPHTWQQVAGVTLLGDAGHLRTPFGGDGANLAMLEGYELATTLAEHLTVDDAVHAYEQVMQPRNAEAGDGVAAVREAFGPGDFDPDSVPDFEREAERWKQRATEYVAPTR